MSDTQHQKETGTKRPPVVAIMGHIDHGKTTLLDHLRKSNVVSGEAGGITQHIAAYEITHTDEHGVAKHITFIDTPGHEAFQAMRNRGASIADIVILIVSAEDGPKPQTLEAYEAIKASNTPFIVAINKIDKPNADPEKVKRDLMEHGIDVEGMGGDIPVVAISAQTGAHIDELLSLLLLLSDIEELAGDPNASASGTVIETRLDPKKGISGTLIIKNGTLKTGSFVVSGNSMAPVRIMEDFTGTHIQSATLSRPVRIVGWNTAPEIGAPFQAVSTKKEAEALVDAYNEENRGAEKTRLAQDRTILPIILKTDVLGSVEAVKHEISKIDQERIHIAIVSSGIGTITEGDVKQASGKEGTLIIGFHVTVDARAIHLAERMNVTIKTFDIIYELAEYLAETARERTPKETVEEVRGDLKVLKLFSSSKDKQVLGGEIIDGTLRVGNLVHIMRRGNNIGTGTILEIQQQKSKVEQAQEGQCGMLIQSKREIAVGDHLQAIETITR